MTDSHVRLLVVDDEESLRIPLKRYLERNFGYQVDAVGSSTAALEQARTRHGRYDVALIDEVLVEGLDGIETMQELQALYPDLEVIIFTGWGAQSKQRALRAGAFRYLEKPVNYDELAAVIRTAAQQVRLREIGRVILAERDLARVLEQICGAANSLALGDEAAIVLQEPHSYRLRIHARTHSDGAQWQRHFVNRWASREIINSSRVLWVPDTEGETGIHPEVLHSGVRSFLGVPIPGQAGNLGALYVYSQNSGRFEDWGTVSVLQTLAGHAGLALTNIQAFGQLRAQAVGMESLVRAARELTSATKLEEQLEITWTFVREQLRASTFFVSLYDESTDTVSFPLSYDEYELAPIPERILGDDPAQWGATGWVIKHSEELHWNSREQQRQQCANRGITPSIVGKPSQSCFFLPLTRGTQVMGVVSIQSYDPYSFDSVLLDTFRALGSQLVAAMENTRLLEAEARRRREAETLREAALTLTTTLELQEIFERILSELQKVVPYDSASIQLLNGDQLEIIRARGFPNPDQILGLTFTLKGDNPNREVVQRRDWFIVDDAPSVYRDFSEEPTLHADIRGWLGVPMLVGDRIAGMIALDKHEPGFYTEEHARLAQTFAAQAAVAFENGRLFSELGAAMEWRAALVEHAFDALIAIDENSKITVFNRQAEKLFGLAENEVLESHSVGELHFDIEKAREVDRVLRNSGSVSGWEVAIRHRDGTPVPVLLSATVLRNNEGNPIGQAGFMRDLREVKLLESRLWALMAASQAVAGALVLDEVLDRIVKAAVMAFPPARGGFIRLHDEQANALRLEASTYPADRDLGHALDLNVGEGIAGWVFQHRSPVNIPDAEQDPRYKRQRSAQLPALKSIICAPLQVRGQAIGTLSLENRNTVGAFEDQDLDLLRSFADQAAIAIVNASLFEETEESKENLRSLYEASSALISAQEPEQVLQDIVEQARLAAKASWAKVILVDEAGHAQSLVRAGKDGNAELDNVIRPEGLTMQVMRTGKAVTVEDRDREPEHVNTSMFQDGVAAAACLPLTLQGKQIGVMWIHYEEPRRFPAHEIDALQLYANQAAIAYDNARRMRELEHMRQAAEAMAGKAEVDEVLEQIADSARDLLGGDSAAIWSYDDMRGRFIPEETKFAGIPCEAVADFRKNEPKESGTARTVMERGWVGVSNTEDPTTYGFEMGSSTRALLASIGAQSFQGIALKAGNETLGVLYINYSLPRSFGCMGRKTLTTFAYHAALALKKARLLGQVRKAKTAAEVVARVTALGEPKESLRAVAEGTQEAMGCDAVVLFGYNQARSRLEHPPTLVGVRFPDRASRLDVVAPNSVVHAILEEDELYIVERVSEDPLFSDKRFAQDEKIESCVATPLQVGDQKVGVMFVNYRTRHRFTKDELTNLELFSNQAAVAIQNAQLYQQRQRWAKVQETLNKASRIITSSLDLAEVIAKVAKETYRVCRSLDDKGDLFSFVALVEGDILTPAATYPTRSMKDFAGMSGGISLSPDDGELIGITGRAAVTEQTQLVVDVTQDPDYIELEPATRSELAVPMLVGGEIIGVISVEHGDRDAFDSEYAAAIQSLAAQAGLAIQHAKLFEAERRHAQAMESIQATSSAVSSVLDLEELLPMITREAASIFSAPASSLMLWDAPHEHLVIRAASGLGSRYREEQRIAIATVDSLIETRGLGPHVFNIAQLPFGRPDLIDEEGLCTVLVAPLVQREQLIGILCVYSRHEPRSFGEKEEELARVFANHAAIAIQNARLYDQANERAAVLQTLYEAGKAVTSTLTLDEILDQIVKQACNLAAPQGKRMHFSHLALVEGNRIWFEAANSPEIRDELWRTVGEIDLEHSQPVGIVGRVVKTKESQNVGDTTQDPDHIRLRPTTHSQLAVPVMISDRVIGVINVEHPEYDAFNQEDQVALEHLAAQAAVAIQNARLYEQARIVADISREAARRLELDAFLETLFGRLDMVFQERQIPVYMCLDTYDNNTNTLTPHPTTFYPVERPESIPLTGQSIVVHVAETRECHYAPDVSQDLYYHSLLPDIRSEFAVPIRFAGELVGILNLESPTMDAFTLEDQQLLRTLADQIATTIRNVQHFEALKQIKGFVGSQTVLDWIRMVSTAWGHGIKREVGTSLVSAELVRQAIQKGQYAEALAELADLETTVTGIKDIPITAPLSAEDAVTSVRINRLVQGYLRNLWRHSRYGPIDGPRYDLQENLDSVVTVRASEEWIRRGLEIVIDNAVQAMLDEDSLTKELHVATRRIDGHVQIEIRDTGPGIPPELIPLLFKKPIDKGRESRGAGVGLVLANNIFEAYHGSIGIKNTGPSGTTIMISLPVESSDSKSGRS